MLVLGMAVAMEFTINKGKTIGMVEAQRYVKASTTKRQACWMSSVHRRDTAGDMRSASSMQQDSSTC